jgi:tetratricopeptide (TPR) repeat protein
MAQAQESGAADRAFDAVILRAQCDMREQRADHAIADLRLALENAREASLWQQESAILDALGDAYARVGDLAAARDCFGASLAIDRRHGQCEGALTELLNLAFVAVRAGSIDEARGLAVQIVRELAVASHHFHECSLLDVCACLAAMQEDWSACLRGHFAASRHFAAAGYVESPQRRHRRESDEAMARGRLAPAEVQELSDQAEKATLAQELARVADWLGVAAPC